MKIHQDLMLFSLLIE